MTPSQEARTVDHLPGTTGDSLEDAMKWAASQEAREYPPLPKSVESIVCWSPTFGSDTVKPHGDYYTEADMRSYVDSDRKARQQEALRCIAFFASCIKSGEPWTDECQRVYDAATLPR